MFNKGENNNEAEILYKLFMDSPNTNWEQVSESCDIFIAIFVMTD